jgi:hypothetical protein
MNKRVTGLSFALSIALFACVGAVSENDRPCPCATGWTCCSSNVCVGPGASCPASDIRDAMASASEAGLAATGMDATLGEADGNAVSFLDVAYTDSHAGGSCPDIAGLNNFGSVSDAASVLVGRWVQCSGDVGTYGGPQTNLVSLGAPADAVGVEFAAATAGGGSCEAVNADPMPCAGGLVYYIVAGPAGLARGQGNAYQTSYAVVDNGSPGLELVWGETPTDGFNFGPPGPAASAQVLSIEASDYAFVSLVALSFFEAEDAGGSDSN